MAEATQQLNTLMGINGLAAVIWFVSALVAYSSYRAFKQFADLGWTVTFILFGAIRIGYIWEAMRWRDNLQFLNPELVTTLSESNVLRLGFASLELIAVFLVLYFFRARRNVV